MKKLDKSGFGVIEAFLVVLVILIVVVVGWLVISHRDAYKGNPNFTPIALGTFSFGGGKFPKLPTDFVYKDRDGDYQTLEGAEVDYLNLRSIPQIEIELTNVCKGNNFQIWEAFSNIGDPDYNMLCSSKNYQTNWQFDITNSNKPKVWEVSVVDLPEVNCSEPEGGGVKCGPAPCKTITVYGDSACKN